MTAESIPNVRPLRDHEYVPGCPGWAYRRPQGESPGRVFRIEGKDDKKAPVPILKWCPDVIDHLVTLREDGSPDGRHYRVGIGRDVLVASHTEVRKGEVWDRAPDAVGADSRTMRDVLTAIIGHQAAVLDRTLAVTRTGWHTTPEGRMYVSADGRARPGGQVELIGAPAELARAAAPMQLPDGHTLADVLATVADRGGWAPLLGIAAGARALGQTLRPVPAALVVVGPPNTGKTCVAAGGRMLALAPSWPPLPTAKMSEDTVTDIEIKIDFEADMPTLLDDLALTLDAPALVQRDAIAKLERIIRAVGNGGAMRGRRKRDLTAQEQRHVRTIPVITAQALPPGMQASLYRRAVVLRLVPGDADWRWWKQAHEAGELADTIGPGLRAIGDRIITRLGEADNPAAVLAEADTAARAALSGHVDREIPGWADSETGMVGVVEMAGAMLAGLALVADAAGVERGPLFDAVAAPLARSLAVQADAMEDRRQATDDILTAVGDVLRHALISRRAHLTDASGQIGPGRGPGALSTQEMGLREAGRDPLSMPVWDASGVPLHYVPAYGGVAIRGASLYDLCRASGDSRTAGHTARSLDKALGRAGGLVPSRERGKAWAHKIRLTGGGDEIRAVVIPERVIWPDLADSEGPEGGRPEQVPPEPPAGPPVEPATNGDQQWTQSQSQSQTASDAPSPIGARTTRPADTGTGPRSDDDQARPPVEPPAASAPAGVVLAAGADCSGVSLMGAAGADSAETPETLPALLGLVVDRMPDGAGTVAIDAETAARIGYPGKPTNTRPGAASKSKGRAAKNPQECRAVIEARTEGWECGQAGIGAWTIWRNGGRSVAVVVLPWLDHKTMRVSGQAYLTADDDVFTAAYLLARYREITGGPYVMTAGTSGVNLIRAEYARPRGAGGRRRRAPRLKWRADDMPADCPAAGAGEEQACSWSRPLTDDERARPYVIGFDARMAYLAAMSTAVLAVDALEPVGLPETGFDRQAAGYWLVSGEWKPFEHLPALTGREGAGPHWLTTPTVALLLRHGMPEEAITDAWLPSGRAPASVRLLHGSPGVAEMIRDGIAGIDPAGPDPEEIRVRDALKATYRETVGMLRRGTPFVCRPDWADTIISTSRATLLGKVIRYGQESGRWPVRIDTDCVYYATATNDPAREAPGCWSVAGRPVLGDGLGQWAAKEIMTTIEYQER